MADPLNPVNTKTLGGLTYDANLVRSARKRNDGKYVIVFKTGEEFIYPEQKPFKPELQFGADSGWVNNYHHPKAVTGEALPSPQQYFSSGETVPRNASIKLENTDGLLYDTTNFTITNVMGGYFSTSEKTISNVTLKNSSGTTIDLAANDSAWFSDYADIKGGANNRVILDSKDNAIINDKIIRGEGTASQKDY